MNREVTKFFPENNDSKIGRRSLLGMTLAGLAGYLVATEGRPLMPARFFGNRKEKTNESKNSQN
jgi:hypothetical protein